MERSFAIRRSFLSFIFLSKSLFSSKLKEYFLCATEGEGLNFFFEALCQISLYKCLCLQQALDHNVSL